MDYETDAFLTDAYIKGDCCYATVTSRDCKGSYLELDNGQGAYVYGVGNLPNGTKILCTITRSAIPGTPFPKASCSFRRIGKSRGSS